MVISKTDYEKLCNLTSISFTKISELLDEEINRTSIVSDEKLPSDVVCMNSEIQFLDIDSNVTSTIILVYPEDTDLEANKISVLAPVGAALIGLRVNQTIDWPLPSGKTKRIRVTSVIRQNIDELKSKIG